EKVLMVKRSFVEENEETHLQLISALLEACRYCALPENRERVIELLAQRKYVGASRAVVGASLGHTFDFGNGRVEQHPDFHLFFGHGLNEPSLASAHWVVRSLHASGTLPPASTVTLDRSTEWFRPDIYAKAL